MNLSLDPSPLASSLRDFVLGLNDAVLVLGAGRQIVLANAAARSLFALADGACPVPLAQLFGANAAARVQALLAVLSRDGEMPAPAPLPLMLENGRNLKIAAHRIEPQLWLLRLDTAAHGDAPDASVDRGRVSRELLGIFWDSPFPAILQGSDFRLVEVNEAFLQFSGYSREQLIGVDPSVLQPESDRQATVAGRRHLSEMLAGRQSLEERRLLDAQGRERWFRAARRELKDEHGRSQYLALLQDCTPEHAAREQADRSENDLNQWFDMSPVGMALFDAAGLLVRTNPALEALVGVLPVMLDDASLSVRRLLAWEEEGPSADLAPGAPPLRRQAWSLRPGGGQARLGSLVRGYVTPAGHRRYMAAVQDLSAEDERDLARMQIGAVMDTAGVGVATFQDSMPADNAPAAPSMAPRPADAQAEPPVASRGSNVLQSIGRDLVERESLPEYERLQQALRRGERIEARYAIRHPELGVRWLLTRVEPGQLASGKRTTSVVTLDVTDKEQAQARNDQLLRELGTILESSPAGIVYLRGETLLRCNRRFERMVGLPRGTTAGRNVHELLAGLPAAHGVLREILATVDEGSLYETELEMPRADGLMQWASLSARCFRSSPGALDVIAVLSDITRLKLQQAELETLVRDRELMFSLSEVGIAFIRHGRVQRANEAMEQLTGHAANELAGLEVAALFSDGDSFQRALAAQEAALREHGRWSGERELRRSDGSLVWVQVSKRLVVDGDVSGGVIASFVNIDDRRRAEASVALQAETTRAVLDSVLVGIVTVGRDGIEWMNRSARRMFGGGLAEFRGQPISTVATPEEDHPFRRTHYLDALNEGQAETFECRVKAHDGREFWVAGNAVVTRHVVRGRQLTYALLDIERRRSAEVRTARAQASLQRIIDMAPLAIALCDARSLRVLQINPTALAITGRADSDVIGRAPEEIYAPAFAAQVRADMKAALVSTTLTQHEYKVQIAGQPRVLDARYLPLAALGETPDQLLLVATDVTEQRAADKARFDAALAQRDRLVQEVHHRIKNNLQGVAGLLQQMAQRRPEVAGILAEGVGQVQAIAQVYGLQVGVTGPLRVKSLVEAITGSVQRSLGREVTLSLAGGDESQWPLWVLPEAESIPIALTLNELLSNAVKHSPEASPLLCLLAFGMDRVRIEISNTGALPAGFDVSRVPGGISGLGLVRALLPRRHSRLEIVQQAERVVASVELVSPGVTLLPPP